jgi:phasin family protein
MAESSDHPVKSVTEAATHAAQRGMQAAQDMGRRAAEASLAGVAEFTRMFGEMKLPAMPDMDTFLQAHRRNMETLSAANRVALEGAQNVAKRHMEIVQQTMQEMTEAIRELSSPDSPQTRAAKQAEMVKHAYERAVAHLKELADLIQRANGEALEMLDHRFREAMDEVKAMAEKSGQKHG